MGFFFSGKKQNFPNMRNSRDRSVSISEIHGRQQLSFYRSQRSSCSFLQHIQSSLEVQSSLVLSSTKSNTQSSINSERNNSTEMGPDVLDVESSQWEQRTSSADSRSGKGVDRINNWASAQLRAVPFSLSMDNWMWRSLTNSWFPKERTLVTKSWRNSTLKTYKAPFKRWLNWFENYNSILGLLSLIFANVCIEDKLSYHTIPLP